MEAPFDPPVGAERASDVGYATATMVLSSMPIIEPMETTNSTSHFRLRDLPARPQPSLAMAAILGHLPGYS